MNAQRTNPYMGPEYFTRAESHLFFGRKQEIRDLVSLVATERLLLFYAPSGAGKTSLLNAKVIPQLQEKRYEVLPVGRVSGAAEASPEIKNIYIFNLMNHLASGDQKPERFARLSLTDFLWHLNTEDGVHYTYGRGEQTSGRSAPKETRWPRVLILDQFEELVTAYPAYWRHREAFFRELDEAMHANPMLRVVMSLRSDFVQDFDRYAGMLENGMRARYHMLPLSSDDAQAAIEEPARLFQRPFDTGVAEKLVQNLSQVREQDAEGRPHAMPGEWVEPIQLQVVCYQLWEKLTQSPGDLITLDHLKQLARTVLAAQISADSALQEDEDRLLSGLVDGALAIFYEDALAEALNTATGAVDEAFLRSWFSTKLITESGSRSFLERGKDETAGVPQDIVKILMDKHLLRSDARGSMRLVELVHDRFVPPIRDANRLWNERRMQAHPWIAAGFQWYQSGVNAESRNVTLLLSDAALKSVLEQTAGQQLEPPIAAFLAASESAQKKRETDEEMKATRRQAEEAQRRAEEQRNLAQIQTKLREAETKNKEEAQHTAQRLKVRNRGLSIAITFAALASLLAVWFGVVATRNANIANQNAEVAKRNFELANQNAAIANQNLITANLNLQLAVDQTRKAENASADFQSLSLANQSWNAADIADRLLLARAAVTISDTLDAQSALLGALGEAYQVNGAIGVGVSAPFEALDFQSQEQLTSLVFSDDGRILVLAGEEGGVWLWDNVEQKLIAGPLTGHQPESIYDLAFDPVHHRLASASGDRNTPTAPKHNLILWDLTSGEPQPEYLARNAASMWSVDFSPDGETLAVGNQDGSVSLWDLSTTTPVSRTLPGRHNDWAYFVAYDHHGQRLASAGKDGVVLLWSNLAGSQPLSITLAGHADWVNAVAFSPDDATLASASDDGTVRLWDVTVNPPASIELDNYAGQGFEAWELAFSADGKFLAVGWGDALVRIYPMGEQRPQPWLLAGHQGEVWNLAFDPRMPHHLVSLSTSDSSPLVWNLDRPSALVGVQPLLTMPLTATLLGASQDGHWTAATQNQQIHVVDATDANHPVVSFSSAVSATAVALSADGRQIAVAGCAVMDAIQNAGLPAGTEQSASPLQSNPIAIVAAPPEPEECSLELWQLDASGDAQVAQQMTTTFPVRALAFHPTTSDLVVGLESGDIQIRGPGLALSAVTGPSERVFELKTLAFSSDGALLAALSRAGFVTIWSWPDFELAHQSQPSYGAEEGQRMEFDDIAFVQGSDWFVIASSEPTIEFWRWRTSERVARFEVASGRIALLRFEPEQQTLVALQPDQVLQWSMRQSAWLELACVRAGRNLSYRAWQTVFPGEESTAKARICDYPLDRSFAEAKIDDATALINDCTRTHLERGLTLLTEASAMGVDPPIELDPGAKAVGILADTALDYLQQQSTAYDQQALSCLRLAYEQVGRSPTSASQALDLGRSLIKAEVLLAAPQLANIDGVVDDLENVVAQSALWPVDLSTRARPQLQIAYFRQCQQIDAESAKQGCEKFTAMTDDLLRDGNVVTGVYRAGADDSRYFTGKQGDLAVITMNVLDYEFYGVLRVEGPTGFSRTSADDSDDELLLELLLPQDGIFRITPESRYGDEGRYRLALNLYTPQAVAFDQPQRATTRNQHLWQFTGATGQLVAISLEATDISMLKQSLRLWDAEFNELRTDSAMDHGNGILLATVLPKDGVYTFQPGRPEDAAAYTLTLTTPALQPLELAGGRPISMAAQADAFWSLVSQAGKVIDVRVDTVAAPDRAFRPGLLMLDPTGARLASDNLGGEKSNARIADVVLPVDGSYIVVSTTGRGAQPYTLTAATVTPPLLTLPMTKTATGSESMLWAFMGHPGQLVQATVRMLHATPQRPAPGLALVATSGMKLDVGENEDGSTVRIGGYIVQKEDLYYLRVSGIGRDDQYELVFAEATPRLVEPGAPAQIGSSPADSLWALETEGGQAYDITLTLEDTSSYRYPMLTVYGTDGARLYLMINRDSYDSITGLFIAPTTGRHIIRAVAKYGPVKYTLSTSVRTTPELKSGVTEHSTTKAVNLWAYAGQAGQVVQITATSSDYGDDPSLFLLGPNGATMASGSQADDSRLSEATIAGFVIPQNGRYFIRVGLSSSTSQYRLTLTEGAVEQRSLGSQAALARSVAVVFAGQDGQWVWLHTSEQARLTMISPDASVTGPAREILTRLHSSGSYTLGVGLAVDAAPTELHLDQLPALITKPLGLDAPVHAELGQGLVDYWSITATTDRAFGVELESATPVFTLALYAPNGALVAEGKREGELTQLSSMGLSGDFMLAVRGADAAARGPYTLTLTTFYRLLPPQACSQTGDASDFGPVMVGSSVILGRHRAVDGSENWAESMTQYVGKTAAVTSLVGVDGSGCPIVRVDIDNGGYVWRIRDLLLVMP